MLFVTECKMHTVIKLKGNVIEGLYNVATLVFISSCVCAKWLNRVQLCNPKDWSLQAPLFMGFSRPRILQWVATSLLQGIFPTQGLTPGLLHCRQIFLPSEPLRKPEVLVILSMGYSRQEYWSGLPWLPPGDLPDVGIKPMPLMSLALAGKFLTIEPPEKPLFPHMRQK